MVFKKEEFDGRIQVFDISTGFKWVNVTLLSVSRDADGGQGDQWQEDGGSSLFQVQHDGSVQFPAIAALVCESTKNRAGLSWAE